MSSVFSLNDLDSISSKKLSNVYDMLTSRNKEAGNLGIKPRKNSSSCYTLNWDVGQTWIQKGHSPQGQMPVQ